MAFLAPVIKVAATFLAKNVIAKAAVKLVATAVISKVATKAISKLIAKRANTNAPSGGDGGGRIQLPPATDNKLPVVYGTAYVGGPIIDAKISTDQKYMWYVIGLCEVTDTGTITFDTANGVFLDGKKVNFGTAGAVASLSTNSSGYSVQTDTRMANKIYIWLFNDGVTNCYNVPGTNAQTLLSDSTTGGGIPADLRWNSTLYTNGGQSPTMNNTAFAVVRVEYNPDAGTTGLPTLQVKVTNNITVGETYGCRPKEAIYDYMTNTRYGCAIPPENIDTTSLDTLNTYSNQTISYFDVNGSPATQPYRYRINGPLDTSQSCLDNLQFLVDSCDSWLQYNEASGKWRVIPNMPYSGTLANLYNVSDSVLIGGIQINPIDLNDTYNQVEVAYPNTNVRDQTDYQIVDLTDPTTSWYSLYNSVLSPNEAINRLNITLPLVNSAVQAKYLAARRLLQSREDLVISFMLDYSGIQIDAGDVIRVNHNAYGWVDKLFRVSTVSEVQDENGSLSAGIEAFEYNGSIYTDVAVVDYVPADNTGLIDPNVISAPCPPVITTFTDANALVTGFSVETCVPEQGLIKYMDFNYGTTNVVSTHQLYRTVQAAVGQPFVNSVSVNAANVANNTFYRIKDSGNTPWTSIGATSNVSGTTFTSNLANVNIANTTGTAYSTYTPVTITVNDLPAANYYWSATARNDTAGRFSDGSAAYTWGGANIRPYNPISNTGGISGTQIKSNTITIQNFQSGMTIQQRISGNNFSISEGNPQANLAPVLFPEPAFANTVRNIPIYFYGVDVGFNIYPYQAGTSTNTSGNNGNNYYAASSTGPYEPADASILTAGDSEDNWWTVSQDDFPAGSLVNGQTLFINSGFTATTDTPGAIIQILQGYKTGNNTYFISPTIRMDTLEMTTPEAQYSWERVLSVTYSPANSITGAATLVRCITANATIIITSGSIQTLKGQAPFF